MGSEYPVRRVGGFLPVAGMTREWGTPSTI